MSHVVARNVTRHLCRSGRRIQPSTKVEHDTTRNTRGGQLLHRNRVCKSDVVPELLQLAVVVALCSQRVDYRPEVQLFTSQPTNSNYRSKTASQSC